MAQVTVTINDRDYEIACDDGQENHLIKLSQFVNKRLRKLTDAIGQVGDARLLVMASLLLADELSEVYTEPGSSQNQQLTSSKSTSNFGLNSDDLDLFTSRIENIVENFQQSKRKFS